MELKQTPYKNGPHLNVCSWGWNKKSQKWSQKHHRGKLLTTGRGPSRTWLSEPGSASEELWRFWCFWLKVFRQTAKKYQVQLLKIRRALDYILHIYNVRIYIYTLKYTINGALIFCCKTFQWGWLMEIVVVFFLAVLPFWRLWLLWFCGFYRFWFQVF